MNRALVAAILALTMLSGASAQELPGAEAALSLSGGAPQGLKPGAIGNVALTATVTAHGFACAQDGTITVAFEADHAGATEGVVLEVGNATEVIIPAGAYTEQDPFEANAIPGARLLVARFSEPGSTSTITVTSHVAASNLTACTTGALSADADLDLTVKLADVPPGDPAFHPTHEAHGGSAFEAVLEPGQTYEWTATPPGQYTYHDHFDPTLKGTVRVLTSGAPETATIRITGAGFDPATATVLDGGTVTWTNEDDETRWPASDEQHGVPAFDASPGDEDGTSSTVDGAEENETPFPWMLTAAAIAAAATRAPGRRRAP